MTAPQPDISTVALVRDARAGSEEAFAQLYELHRRAIARCAALWMGKTLRQCHQDVEDVEQEAFAEAFERVRRGEFDENSGPGSFRKWLSVILLNRIRERGRRSSALKRGGGKPAVPLTSGIDRLPAAVPGPETHARVGEIEEKIERAMLQLEEERRNAIVLKDICGLSSEEMAKELGCRTAAAARGVLYYARRDLHGVLRGTLQDWETYLSVTPLR